jgi:hypothetical protein
VKIYDFEARGVGDPAVSGSAKLSGTVTPADQVNRVEALPATSRSYPSTPSPEDLLDFERTAPGHPAAKARACRERFGFGLVRYYQELHRACRVPAAILAEPLTALRIQRLQTQRRRRVGTLSGHYSVLDLERTKACGWCEGVGLVEISPGRAVTCRRCDGRGVIR